MKWNFLMLVGIACAANPAPAADWPQFLGPQRSGVSLEQTKLTEKFPADGPTITWKFSCGTGFAGPVVAGGTLFLFHRVGDEARLEAMDSATGAKQWTFRYQTNYKDTFGFDNGPRACPTVAEGRVFLYGAEGLVHAVEAKSGKLLWKRDVASEFGGEQGFFGRAGAPLVVEGLVLVSPGGPKGSVVALDVATGVPKWHSGQKAAGYASPVLWASASGPVAVFLQREGVLGVDPVSGRVRFEAPFRASMEASVNAATPVIISPTEIFTTASYDTGAVLWKYAEGQWSSVWKQADQLDCHYATPVFVGGYLYGMHGRQEQGQELRCLTAATGKVQWSSPSMAAGECISTDGKLIVITDRGECLLVKCAPDKFEVLDRGQILSAGHRAPPAIVGGILYARDKTKLVAVRLTELPDK